MDGLHIFIFVLLGVVAFSHDWISGSALERTVRPGDNVTFHCDCKLLTGKYILWYRNCSHENQPSLVLQNKLEQTTNMERILNPLPRFHFVRNLSSDSYDLLIINITETDEGLYYCGTEKFEVQDEKKITPGHLYTYGNISTRIRLIKEPHTDQQTPQTRLNQDEDVCYAALEYRQASQKPKRKATQSSDFSTYSAINTSRM
ncbi:uncharacterized protein LOC134864986 isoform X2 [Eleginops maclovinus]|uniref:uncharacterized protein LOC134864986 isoform X2 n=1 Tax=Eleginops maclovinus TaxID=56733 RepID=UPI0030800FE7